MVQLRKKGRQTTNFSAVKDSGEKILLVVCFVHRIEFSAIRIKIHH